MHTVNYLFGFFSSFLRKKSKRVFFRKRKTVLSAFFDKTVFVYEFFGRRQLKNLFAAGDNRSTFLTAMPMSRKYRSLSGRISRL